MNITQRSDKTIILFFCFLSLVLVSIWFRSGNLFLGAEEGIPFYDLTNTLKIYSSTWLEEYLGIAYLIDIVKMPFFSGLLFLNRLGINSFFLQTGTFFLLLFGGSVSVYFLFKNLFKELSNPRYPAFFGALFYLLNPYSISDIWSRGIYNQYFAFFYYPLFLWMFILFLDSKKYIFLLVGLIASFVLSSAMGNPSYAISLWSLVGTFGLFYLLTNLKKRSNIINLFTGGLIYFFGWLALNCWWLVIFLRFAPGAYLVKGSGFQNAYESLQAVSQQSPFINTIRLFHAIRFGPDFYGTIYDNWGLIFISFILPMIILLAVYFYKQTFFKFLAVLFLISLFVCLGTNPPFGWLFSLLFKQISIFQVFRNPYEKFGLVYLLAYAGLFGLGMTVFRYFLKKRFQNIAYTFFGMILILIHVILIWPIWSGDVIGWGTKTQIPVKYDQYDAWQKKHNPKDEVSIFLPFLPTFGAAYNWGGGVYHGSDPLYQIIDSSVITQEGINPYLVALRAALPVQDVSGALALLRVGFVVNRTDVVSDLEGAVHLHKILENQESNNLIYKEAINDLPIFYPIKKLPVSEISAVNTLSVVKNYQALFNKANQVDISQAAFLLEGQNDVEPNLDRIFDNQIQEFKKFSQMRYFIQFRNPTGKMFYLTKTFDPQWKVIPLDTVDQLNGSFTSNIKLLFLPSVDESTHFIINGYANGWVIDDFRQNYAVIYIPQLVMEILWKIVLAFFASCMTGLIILLIKISIYDKK